MLPKPPRTLRFATLLLTISLSFGLVCSGWAQAPGTEAGYWKLNENTGKTSADSSPHGLAGELQGTVGWITPGKGSLPALHLTGMGNVDIPAPVVDTRRSFTVSAWVRVHQPGGFQTFVSIDGDTVSGFFLQLRGDSGKFAFTLPAADATPGNQNAGGQIALVSAGFQPQIGVWYHLMGVHDADAKTIALYVDGLLQQTAPFDSSWQAKGHTEIGRAKYAGMPVDFAKADITEVRIYSTVHIDPNELARIAQETHAGESILTIDTKQSGHTLSPMLYGLMIEDINHSIDGGLYGELIQNRVLKDNPTKPTHWSVVPTDSGAAIALDTTQPVPATVLTNSLRLDIPAKEVSSQLSAQFAGKSVAKSTGGKGAGIANDGYWGIPVRSNMRYRASFYAKASPGYTGPLTLAIESADGGVTYAQTTLRSVSSQWKPYTATLLTGKTSPTAHTRFVIRAQSSGTLWFTQVSLFAPTWHNRPNGTRPDLMQLLADMKPAFLRLPGGNYLEGNTIAERFEWKDTIHNVAQRPGHQDPWNYRSDDGFGLLEYLEWCEDLHMAPLVCVFAGYALNGEHVVAGAGLKPFVDDALDELEYVTGGTDTKWGAQRAADGHPAPFSLTYVEIGNEDGFDRSGSYGGRFAQFYDAIKAKYPKLLLIATEKVRTRTPDVLDEHFYRTAQAMEDDSHHYDSYSRTGPKIFVGEWASQDIDRPWENPMRKGPTPSLNSALGDAAWMTGMERNSDLVVISAYAPLFVNVNPNARQWAINLIGYDALSSYGSPSYYAQKMFSVYHGDVVMPASLTGLPALHYVVSKTDKSGTYYIKVVNTQPAVQTTKIVLAGAVAVGDKATVIVLASDKLTDTNTLADPTHVIPRTTSFTPTMAFKPTGPEFNYTFAPYSVTVLTLTVH